MTTQMSLKHKNKKGWELNPILSYFNSSARIPNPLITE